MITKEVVLDKIEVVFKEESDDNRYPHIQARGKIELREDGVKIADVSTFRFSVKGPDQDAGDQPDAPMGKEKIAVPQGVKDQLRVVQQQFVTPEIVNKYKNLKNKDVLSKT
jgi:hypothetical protein